MATKRNRRTSERGPGDPAEERERQLAEAREEAEERVRANERMHEEAQRKGARMKPHEADFSQPSVAVDRVADEGATVKVEVGRDPGDPADIGQQRLGMGPLKAREVKMGAALQPPGRSFGAWTLPTNTKEDGKTPLVFVNPGTGGALGTQQAKATGAQQVLQSGPGAGIVFADFPASGPAGLAALPIFSDRLALDSDVHAGNVVPSGASNLPRAERPQNQEVQMSDSAEMPKAQARRGVVEVGADRPRLPERVDSDRVASSEEELTQVVDPRAWHESGKPATGGGEALGMGETIYLGGKAPYEVTGVVTVDRHAQEGEPGVIEGTKVEEVEASKAETSSGAKAADAVETKADQAIRGKRAQRSSRKGDQQGVVMQQVEQADDAKGQRKAEVTEIPVATPDDRPADQANADDRPADQANAEATGDDDDE